MAIVIPQDTPQTVEPPRIQASADETTFGGGPGLAAEGQEIQKIASSGGEIGTFEKIRADQTAGEEAQAKMLGAQTDILYNPQTGILTSKGKDALQAQEDGRKRFKDMATQIMGTLHGPEQQGPFQKWVQKQSYDFDRVASVHVDQQLLAHDNASLQEVISKGSGLAAMGHGDPNIIANNLSTIDKNLDDYAKRNRLDEDVAAIKKSDVHGQFHSAVITEMADEGNYKGAGDYFKANMDDIDPKFRKDIKDYLDVVPKQHEETAKQQQADMYKKNMKQAMTDMFDGKMTLTEAQRRFREGQLNQGDYDILQSNLNKPDAQVMRQFVQSDPQTFNSIRNAQLTGTKDPGEIQRMIAQGSADKKITPDDGKYLLKMNSEKPPTPRDKYIDAQAASLRDFGNRYFAEKNMFGMTTDKDKTSQATENLVSSFYNAVDKSKVQSTKDIDDLHDHIMQQGAAQRYPGLGKLDKMPDVVIDVKGRVTRLLNPDQHSGLKPKYKITPTAETESDKKE
jgi:hypothetical protein